MFLDWFSLMWLYYFSKRPSQLHCYSMNVRRYIPWPVKIVTFFGCYCHIFFSCDVRIHHTWSGWVALNRMWRFNQCDSLYLWRRLNWISLYKSAFLMCVYLVTVGRAHYIPAGLCWEHTHTRAHTTMSWSAREQVSPTHAVWHTICQPLCQKNNIIDMFSPQGGYVEVLGDAVDRVCQNAWSRVSDLDARVSRSWPIIVGPFESNCITTLEKLMSHITSATCLVCRMSCSLTIFLVTFWYDLKRVMSVPVPYDFALTT